MARNASIPVDGYSTIDQGVGIVKGRGTKMVRCDIDQLFNWWGAGAPLHVIAPIPLDKKGQPMRMCNQGHYAPLDDFGKRNGEKDKICLKCRKIQRLNHTLYKSG